MTIRCVSFLLGTCLVGLALPNCDARGGTILVFGQTNATSPSFIATRSGSSTDLSATDVSVTITQLGLVPSHISAFFSLSATNVTPASVDGSGHISESFVGTFGITSGTGGTGTNYLSGTFTDTVFGAGSALTLAASSSGGSASVAFTSGVLAPMSPPRGMSLAFTDVTPTASLINNTLDSFASNVAGTFSSAIVPEPASVMSLGLGIGVVGIVGARRRMRYAIRLLLSFFDLDK